MSCGRTGDCQRDYGLQRSDRLRNIIYLHMRAPTRPRAPRNSAFLPPVRGDRAAAAAGGGLSEGKTTYPRQRGPPTSSGLRTKKHTEQYQRYLMAILVIFAMRSCPRRKTPRVAPIRLCPLNLQGSRSTRNNRRTRRENGKKWQYYEAFEHPCTTVNRPHPDLELPSVTNEFLPSLGRASTTALVPRAGSPRPARRQRAAHPRRFNLRRLCGSVARSIRKSPESVRVPAIRSINGQNSLDLRTPALAL